MTARNARLILRYWNENENWIDKFLHVPSVIVFAGHMIDRPERTEPRFPRELESAVAKEIQRKIDMLRYVTGEMVAAQGGRTRLA